MESPFKILKRLILKPPHKLERAYYLPMTEDEVYIERREIMISTPTVILHNIYFIETLDLGIFILSGEDLVSFDIMHKDDREPEKFGFRSHKDGHLTSLKVKDNVRLSELEEWCILLMTIIHEIIAKRIKHSCALEVDQNRIEVWEPKGNKNQLVRVYRNFWNPVFSGEKRDKIIRKRDHEVLGHWRYFRKSNRRCWVRHHRRGDSALGTVITNQIIMV